MVIFAFLKILVLLMEFVRFFYFLIYFIFNLKKNEFF